MNVTRAVLPVMRQQRSGHIISISSTAGLVGFEFGSAYAASKFGVEGWMESLHAEVARHYHDDRQPGVLPHGAAYGAIDELRRAVDQGLRRAPREAARVLEGSGAVDDRQPGAAAARFIAGADAVATAEQVAADLKAQTDAHRELSPSLAFD
jgi:NAD(P)-dependent dehydrogenase (short-subunit alcohol dehydrogenase family)